MEEEKKAVEPQEAAAASAGVETKDSPAPESTEPDPVAELEAARKELAKVREERENYKKGMLLAKGKLKHQEPEEDEEPEGTDIASLVQKEVDKRFAETQEAKAAAAYEALTRKQAEELRELKLSLKSKNASSSIAGGAGSGTGNVATSATSVSYFSPEQIAELKKRGKTDEQIEKIAKLAQGDPFGGIQHESKVPIT